MKPRSYYLKCLPPSWGVLVYIAVLIGTLLRDHLFSNECDDFSVFRTMLIIFSPIGYAVWRTSKFLPFPHMLYGGWLSLTPWKYGQQLPAGPVFFNITDIFVIAIFCLTTLIDKKTAFWIPAIIFALTYIILTTFSTIYISKDKKYWVKRILIIIILPLCVYPYCSKYSFGIIATLALVISQLHIRDLLKDFPWNTPLWTSNFTDDLAQSSIDYAITGWPFSSLACFPKKTFFPQEFKIYLLVAFMVTWWAHCFLGFMKNSSEGFDSVCYTFIIITYTAGLLGYRLLKFAGTMPPISFWGRIFTARFIIPKFDKLWVAVILMILTASASISVIGIIPKYALYFFDAGIFIQTILASSFPVNFEKVKLCSSARFPRSKTIEKRIINPQAQGLNVQLPSLFKQK